MRDDAPFLQGILKSTGKTLLGIIKKENAEMIPVFRRSNAGPDAHPPRTAPVEGLRGLVDGAGGERRHPRLLCQPSRRWRPPPPSGDRVARLPTMALAAPVLACDGGGGTGSTAASHGHRQERPNLSLLTKRHHLLSRNTSEIKIDVRLEIISLECTLVP